MKDNIRLQMKQFVKKIGVLIKNIIKALDMKNVLCLFDFKNSKRFGTILITVVIIGLIINYSVSNRLPYFILLIVMLLFCMVSSFYTTSKIIESQDKFNQLMAGDSVLLVLRTKYKKIHIDAQSMYL